MPIFLADIAAVDTLTQETQHVRTEFDNCEDAVAALLDILRALRRDMAAQLWVQHQSEIPAQNLSLEEQGSIVRWCPFRVGDDLKGVCVVRRIGEEED
jgi:hypothetical protein